ncbi:unnamed protein product [Mytilus coruscus]|uniref:Uncharacterized protein n=1 Tax=Mytilus coruscus TaxID=42192 RepID=A0A6J8CE19_MYTCO|nr:unnamed protein product [Mytilus coruscus]
MNRDDILENLKTNGYVVIPNVLSKEECDEHAGSYKRWYSILKDSRAKMMQRRSVIQSYRVGHFDTTWKIRLKVKPVFEMVWGTKKLLTSVDGIAISMPSETGEADFRSHGDCWMHLDQGAKRRGLHAYQGAVYLEESTDKDYCFRVMDGSHEFHSEFFRTFPFAGEKSKRCEFYKFNEEERTWYENNGCQLISVPVPKGGIVLWDSRTAHDNLAPLSGRPDTNRWRCVCFVSMTPAIWAGKDDIEFKNKAYADIAMTTHWSSQGQKRHRSHKSEKSEEKCDDVLSIKKLPAISRTKEAKLLMGVDSYDFKDGEANGPPAPNWI